MTTVSLRFLTLPLMPALEEGLLDLLREAVFEEDVARKLFFGQQWAESFGALVESAEELLLLSEQLLRPALELFRGGGWVLEGGGELLCSVVELLEEAVDTAIVGHVAEQHMGAACFIEAEFLQEA